MKYIWSLFIFTSLLSCTAEKVKRQKLIEVNGVSITVRDFAQELTDRMQGMDIVVIKNTEVFDKVKNELTLSFIKHAILQSYADQHDIKVENEDVSTEVRKYRQNYPDDISFRASLADEGISFDRWKEKLAKNLLEKKVFIAVTKNIDPPGEKEIKDYYYANRDLFRRHEQYKVKQIVLAKSIDAEKLYKLIKKRGSFEKLAGEYSIGAEASAGGLLGWVDKGASDIFDAAAKLPPRTITKPIKSEFGYHIVKIEERRPAKTLNLKAVQEQIREDLIDERRQKLYSSWFEEQKKQAKVMINEEMLQSLSIELKND